MITHILGITKSEVNAGAIEICKEFLGNASKYPKPWVEKLASAVKEFLRYCEDALALNKTLIGPEQAFFHSQLEHGYKQLTDKIKSFLHIASDSNWDNYKEENMDDLQEVTVKEPELKKEEKEEKKEENNEDIKDEKSPRGKDEKSPRGHKEEKSSRDNIHKGYS